MKINNHWKFKIERKLAGNNGKRSTSSLFPFRRPQTYEISLCCAPAPPPPLVVPYALFIFLTPSSPPLRHKDAVAIVPWVRKTFPLRFRSLLRSSPRSIPPFARKNLWYQARKGIGWLTPTDISYRISSNNSRPLINRHPRIIAPLGGIFNIIASLG